MNRMKALAAMAAVAAAAGMLLVSPGALARGGFGGFRAGPVFGFPRAMVHRPFGHAFARRWPARFAWRFHRWNFQRFAFHNNQGAWNAAPGGAGGYGAYPGDLTGTIPPGPAIL
ncbi:MAG TPA: hypothetical protein VEK73_09745, partial [Xanthobacteraceae bacterium]|nr:hypothetical protein [Xanthobacteraceae bacterium]